MKGKQNTIENKVDDLEKEIKERTVTVTLKESFVKKIESIRDEKLRLQEQSSIIQSLFNKEEQREQDLVDYLLDSVNIERENTEYIKISEDKKSANILMKKKK